MKPHYRMLKKGERIRKGDEFLEMDGQWEGVGGSIGHLVSSWKCYKFRRPLPAKPRKPKPVKARPCVWRFTELSEWRSTCGNTDDTDPVQEVWSFCPFCGKKMETR